MTLRYRPSHLWTLLKKLGWYYSLMLVISLGALKAFQELAEEVLQARADALNRHVLLAIHVYSTPVLDRLAIALAAIGSAEGTLAVTLVCLAVLLRKRRSVDALTLLAAVGGGGALTTVLKSAFHQTRPMLFPRLVDEVSYSFPSGHSLLSFVLYGFLAFWIVAEAPREAWRWAVGAVLVAFAALIAVSRLYLGVHWPTDVLGGAVVALWWLSVCLIGRRWLSSRAARPLAAA